MLVTRTCCGSEVADGPFVHRRPPSVPAAVSGDGLSVLPGPAGPSAGRLEPHADRQLPGRGAAAHLHAALRKTSRTTGSSLREQNLSETSDGVFEVSPVSPQVWQSSDSVVNVCSELDWKRCVAVHLWFMLPPTASVADALSRYEAAFQVNVTCGRVTGADGPVCPMTRLVTHLVSVCRARVSGGSTPAPPSPLIWRGSRRTRRTRTRRKNANDLCTTSASTCSNSTVTGKRSPVRFWTEQEVDFSR